MIKSGNRMMIGMWGDKGGFSLIELILTIALLSILVIIATQSIDISGTKIHGVARVLRSHIQFAQDMAMTQGKSFGFASTSATEYEIFESTPGNPVKDPLTNETFNQSVEPASFSGTVPTITFMSNGHPDITSDAIITLSEGVNSVQVTVARSTGFVSVSP